MKKHKIVHKCSAEFEAFILKYGTITGSSVFGGFAKPQDIDYLILHNKLNKANIKVDKAHLNRGYLEDSMQSFQHGYFEFEKYPDIPVNVLFFYDREKYRAYIKATKILIQLQYFVGGKFLFWGRLMAIKPFRIQLFELLVNYFMGKFSNNTF